MTAAEGSAHAPVLDRVKGQPGVLGLLRGALRAPLHAYLFIGPPGSGRLDASIAFAAALLCPRGGCGECASCQETLALRHPDLEVVERVGASISVKQAREVAHGLAHAEGRPVPGARPRRLPPCRRGRASASEDDRGTAGHDRHHHHRRGQFPSPFVTIASRCVQVQFKPLDDEAIIEVLMGEGVEVATATAVAEAAGGRLDRARLLARDPGFAQRLQRWRTVPSRLDGTGARVAELADELLASIAEPLEVVRTRQAEELALLQEQAERRGENNIPGRSIIEDRHNRELRRVRTDEIRGGLAALSSVCRARLTEPGVAPQRLRSTLAAIAAIDEASTRLSRNVNATMLLQWLLLHLDT